MAQRKRRTPARKKSKKAFLERAGIAAMKGSGSAAMGATVGVVEEAVGEKAAMGTKAAMALGGLATEILVDPQEHPIVSEVGKASLHSAAAVTGYQAGKAATKKAKFLKEERDRKAMLDRLKADMEAEKEEPEAAKAEVKAKKTTRKRQTVGGED